MYNSKSTHSDFLEKDFAVHFYIFVHFRNFAGDELKNPRMTYVVHATFLMNQENSCALLAFYFFNFVKSILSFSLLFMKRCSFRIVKKNTLNKNAIWSASQCHMWCIQLSWQTLKIHVHKQHIASWILQILLIFEV